MPKKVITYEKTARQRKQERQDAEQKAAKKVAPVVTEEVAADPEAVAAAEAASAEQHKRSMKILAIALSVVAVIMVIVGSLMHADSVYPNDNPYVTVELVYGEKIYTLEYELSVPDSVESATDRKKATNLVENFVSQANAGVYENTVFHNYRSGCLLGGKFVKYELPTTPTGSASYTRIVSTSRFPGSYYNVSGIYPKEILKSANHAEDAYQLFLCAGNSISTDFGTGSAHYTSFALVLDPSPDANRSDPSGVSIGRATNASKASIDALRDAIAKDYGTDFTSFRSVTLKSVKVKANLFTKWKNYDFKEEHPSSDYSSLVPEL